MGNTITKTIMYSLALIALYLILAHGAAFNNILKTATSSTIKGVEVLQGRGGTVEAQ